MQFGDWFLESGWCIHAGVQRPQVRSASRNTASLSHPQPMGSGSRNGLLHSINVSGYFSPIKMFYLFLNTYEHWRCTTPCVKQSDTAHHSKNIWFLLFLLLSANLWGTTGSYIEGMTRNHTAGNLYLLNLVL